MKLDFKYYLSIFWRRFPYFLMVAALFTSAGLTVAMILPSEYEARATLLVEAPQIPSDLAASTVQTNSNEQLQIIEQRLMTRQNLIDTANRLNVYGANGSSMKVSEIVADMRRRTTFSNVSGRDTATVVRIAFRAPRSDISAEVTNEFVTLVLQENIEIRTGQAGDTLEFFEQEVERLGAELDTQSTRILEFQSANAEALPRSEEFLRGERSRIEERIVQIGREEASLMSQRERLVEIFARTGMMGTDDQSRTPEQQALFEARRELDDALLVYSDTNPRVRLLRARIGLLEERVATGDSADAEDAASDADTLMDSQLAEVDSRLESLREDRDGLQSTLLELEGLLAQLPANTITLEKLQRDYENIQAQYNQATRRLSAAETGERIELLAKGERITVIEQATAPDTPTKPNRTIIAGAGAGVGVVMGFALIFLLEFLNRSIRRPVELTDRLGIAPIAVLPYIRTDREAMTKRLAVLAVIGFLMIVLPGLLFYVHTTIQPLDVLLEPIVNRLGFSIAPN